MTNERDFERESKEKLEQQNYLQRKEIKDKEEEMSNLKENHENYIQEMNTNHRGELNAKDKEIA